MKPLTAVLASLFVATLCLIGAPNLSINADTRVFFSNNNSDRKALDLFESRYTPSVNLLIAFHAPDGDVFTAERLAALSEVTEKAWRLPYSFRVEGLVNAPHISSDAEGVIISEAGAMAPEEDAAAVRRRVMSDELLVGRLVAADAKTTAINVFVDYPLESSAATGEILDAAKKMIAETAIAEAGFDVWYGGRVASSNAFSTASKNDLARLIPLTFLTFLAILIWLMRSVKIAGALFFTAAVAAASTMGIAGWAGVQINAATAHIPTVIIALGVASLAHLAISVRDNLRRGEDQDAAIAMALKSDARPIALTLVTTSIGFMTLNFADAPPFKQLGALVATGALFCLFYGLVLLPALFRLLRLPVREPRRFVGRAVEAAFGLIDRRRVQFALVIPPLCAVILLGISKISVDDTFTKYFNHSFDFRVHAELIEQNLTGLEVVEFDIGGAEENLVYQPAFVEKVQRFEEWLSKQDKVHHVSSILEVYRRLNQHLTDGAPESHIVPTDRETLAQYILLYEMSLPLGQDINNAITIDKSRSRVTVIMRNASTAEVKALKEAAERWLAQTPALSIAGSGTGLAVMFAYLSSLNVESMIGGTALALALISGILIVTLRNPLYGFMSLVP